MKIVFKSIESVDLKQIFPVIEEQDYKLLEGLSLVIPDSEYEKIQKQGYFKVDPFQISKDLIEVATGANYDPTHAKILAEVCKSSIFMEDMADALTRGVRLNQNVILYGRGGHNKSEGTELILNLMKKEGLITEEPFVLTCGDGLTEEGLFGGINIKKFKDTGELEYLFKNSFLEHEVVVFEEIFDAPPQVLLALKDVMTSKKARKGNQVHPCKTKIFIGLTNKSKEDFSEDDSLEALAQRFPLTLKVEWDSYSKNNFTSLFKKVFGDTFFNRNKGKLIELSEILSINNGMNDKSHFVSPRTAIHAAKLYCDGGDLKYIYDIDKEILNKYYKENKDKEQETADEEMFRMIADYVKNNNLGEIDTNAKLLDLIIGEHKSRTGEDVKVEIDETSAAIKMDKLKYVVSLMDIHKWSAKNMDRAGKKKTEVKEIIEQLKK